MAGVLLFVHRELIAIPSGGIMFKNLRIGVRLGLGFGFIADIAPVAV